MASKKTTPHECESELRAFALSFPEAHEDFPWGERVVKVRKKVFVFMGHQDGTLSLSVKLPESQTVALMLSFTEPTGYGLGRSGWISAHFSENENPPEDMLREWIEESYRAVAPKKLVSRLGAVPPRARKTPQRKK